MEVVFNVACNDDNKRNELNCVVRGVIVFKHLQMFRQFVCYYHLLFMIDILLNIVDQEKPADNCVIQFFEISI